MSGTAVLGNINNSLKIYKYRFANISVKMYAHDCTLLDGTIKPKSEKAAGREKDDRPHVVNGQVLCNAQVVEIYKHKLRLLEPNSFESCLQTAESRIKGQSVPVAEIFGVSPKTVRDIWNRRTWAYATHHLWAQEAGGTASSFRLLPKPV